MQRSPHTPLVLTYAASQFCTHGDVSLTPCLALQCFVWFRGENQLVIQSLNSPYLRLYFYSNQVTNTVTINIINIAVNTLLPRSSRAAYGFVQK